MIKKVITGAASSSSAATNPLAAPSPGVDLPIALRSPSTIIRARIVAELCLFALSARRSQYSTSERAYFEGAIGVLGSDRQLARQSEHAQSKPFSRRPLLVAGRLLLLLILVTTLALSVRASVESASISAPRHVSFVANVPGPSEKQASVPVDVYVPKGASAGGPLTVLIALHGAGGNGKDFASPLVSLAEQYGWVLVAPTFVYDSYLDVNEVVDDDLKATADLRTIISQLPAEISLQLRDRVLIYGFSRGAQVAHRFALLYPAEVLGVASLSAGSYTLPTAQSPTAGDNATLNWPLGIADFAKYAGHEFQPDLVRKVHFFVGVGTRDDQAKDVPRAWDSCSGTTRVARATAFAEALDSLGAPVHFVEFPNAGHKETAEMRQAALDYLAGVAAEPAG